MTFQTSCDGKHVTKNVKEADLEAPQPPSKFHLIYAHFEIRAQSKIDRQVCSDGVAVDSCPTPTGWDRAWLRPRI